MNLHLLRLFTAVADHGGFSRAAEALHISQPAVSKGVRQLEAMLDMALVERGARGPGATVRLTALGRALHDHARGIFALEAAALEDMAARREAQRGHLTVGASTTVAGYWLPAVLAAFQAERPDVDVTLRVGNTDAMARAAVDCAVDLAVVEGAVTDDRLTATVWRHDPLVVVVPPGPEAAPSLAALMDGPWLVREAGSGTRAVTEGRLAALGLTPRRRVEIDSNQGIARAVAAGLGAAMLPRRVVDALLRLGDLRVLDIPEARLPARPLYVLRLAARRPSPLADAFLAHLAMADPA